MAVLSVVLQRVGFQRAYRILLSRCRQLFNKFLSLKLRYRFLIIAGILMLVEVISLLQPYFQDHSYALGDGEGLLSEASPEMAAKITFNSSSKAFEFNTKQNEQTDSLGGYSSASATAYQDPTKGVTVSDPVNNISLTMTPKFKLQEGRRDRNRIVYPLSDGSGWAVYTMQSVGVKEDIILKQAREDTASYTYELQLGNNLRAKIEKDGSLGIYGNSLLSGSVSTGNEKDAALLEKARKNAPKDTLLFTIPAPVVNDQHGPANGITAAYSLRGNSLTVTSKGLAKGNYPLAIDPSIYVVTAQQFMAGNNETNINFDIDNKLIKKGRTTGARFDSWNSTSDLPTATWGGSTAAAGGYIYQVGGINFNGRVFTSQGADSYVVPTGVTSLTLKMWGAGAGGGGGGSTAGAAGGGGGFVESTISVTPGESLSVYVGGGGEGGNFSASGSDAGGGGGGGGASSVYRGGTPLAIAAGGGGGGGARAGSTGGAGGAGGGTSGVAGTSRFTNNGGGGGGGTSSAGGAAGAAASGANAGTAGSSLTGGLGGDGRNGAGADGSGAVGGLALGGAGGLSNVSTTRAGGGGGGAGYFGGGGGSGTTSTTNSGGGGGGGGSSFTAVGSTSVTNTAGSGATPGNDTDTSRAGAGDGGAGGAIGATGSAGDNGIVIISYGSGATTTASVSWAKFNTASGTIDSANPGTGACSGWCSTSAYNLPSARANFSLVAYNGFLYAIGGTDSTGARTNTVYISKLGANGEPQLWHPTNADPGSWDYWYQDANLSTVRAYTGAVAYDNRLYLLGGIGASAPVSTVQIADITGNGTLSSWTSSTSLPSNRYGHDVQVYNDRLYIIGGASTVGGAPSNSVYYNKINSDGTLNSWVQTTSFTTGRMNQGGNMTVVWGAYVYISGGCSAVNGSGYCTAVESDAQVASINADGSLDTWNTMAGVSDSRMAHSLVAWRDNVYEIGGCSAQNTSTGDCNSNMLASIKYGTVNQDGDASTVGQSVNSSTSPCSDATPTNCNLPGTTHIGNMLAGAVITNGYLYVIGGCTNNSCSTTQDNVAYVAISSTGQMTKPATCPSGAYQGSAWCVDTTNVVSGGIAATTPVVFGGRIYLVGGLNGSSNTNSIVRTTVNSDGSIGAWTSQTMTGVGATSVSYLYAFARANPASGSNPGNLYIFGGCTTSSSAGCSGYTGNVYKCNIQTAGAIASCSTSGQLQIGTLPGGSSAGLAIMSGTVYAGYIYLIGGVSPDFQDLDTVRYAKIDNSNNIVTVGSGWVESSSVMNVGRRRAASFGYNGYLYTVGGYDAGTGVLPDIEFVKINVSDGSLVGDPANSNKFYVSGVEINQRWGLSVPVSNSYAYVIGGCTAGASPSGCTTRTDVIQTFQLYNNDSGSPAGYADTATNYNTNRIGAAAAIHNGRIYVAGGCTSTDDCSTAIETVSYATIDAYGTVGSWTNSTGGSNGNLPNVLTWGKLFSIGPTLYYVGGQGSVSTNERAETHYINPNASTGALGSWSTSGFDMPQARTKFGAAAWNGRMYIVGGYNGAANLQNTVYVSTDQSSGGNLTGAWTTSTAFNVARMGSAVTAYANNLYLFGGYDGTNYLSDSQFAKIDPTTGLVGSWSYTTNLPVALAQGDSFAANGYVYVIGGRTAAGTCRPITLAAPISANTTIASGNNPTGVGEWYETNQRYSGDRYGAAAVYRDGKAYLFGGACGSPTLTYPTTASIGQQTALLAQPQVAKYSIMIDTDSDVFPTNWLLNGVDNSIGARWQLNYRSMTNATTSCTSPAMTTWGQNTAFGNVTLGLPGVYTPKDSSGTNTNCARYYYFSVDVDSSQAFGYPDDVSRGPTITDLTLQFTADPSKRLLHGRTFTGGLQQPIDTPYYSN